MQLHQYTYLYWLFGGHADLFWGWKSVRASENIANNTLRIVEHPVLAGNEVAFVDLAGSNFSLGSTTFNLATGDGDRLIIDRSGTFNFNFRGVDYFEAALDEDVTAIIHSKYGFATNGSADWIKADIGWHDLIYTYAHRDSFVQTGDGQDKICWEGDYKWAFVRRDDGQLDAYNMHSGYRVRMADWQSLVNWGAVEEICTDDRNGNNVTFSPPSRTGISGDRWNFDVIDLSDAAVNAYTDRFIAASFKSIHYATQNVYTGTAIVEEFRGDTVADNSARLQSASRDHITTNGNHHLLVNEETTEIDGHLRLYVRDNNSGLYNRFNEVYLGTSASEVNEVNDYSTTSRNAYATNQVTGQGATAVLGTAMYGFGGNDSVTGGSDVDYLFGGTSTFTTITAGGAAALPGNILTGRGGSDYFGVGNISHGRDGDLIMTTDFTVGPDGNRLSGTAPLSTDPSGILSRLNRNGAVVERTADAADLATRVATDRITDWTAGVDYLRVLGNGTAIIEGLGSVLTLTANAVASTSGSNVLTVTDTNHGLVTGDTVIFPVALNVGDTVINANTSYTVTRIDNNSFTLSGTGVASATATGGAAGLTLAAVHTIGGEGETIDLSRVDGATNPMVVNDGKIVARGLGGSDTLVGSAGDDWLYGNAASNYYELIAGGNDRIYIDQFDGGRSKHYVEDFTISTAGDAATNADLVMLNKRVIDAFNSGGINRTALTQNVNAEYTQAQGYSAGLNFLHDPFYNPSIAAPNSVHTAEDGRGLFMVPISPSGSDGTSGYIGLGMVIAGRALLGVPFVGPIIGGALIATGTLLGGAGNVVETTPHQNATYAGDVSAYLNVLTDDGVNAQPGVMLRIDTTVGTDDAPAFLEFFDNSNAGDGYVPVVEFSAHSGDDIHGYFALHSDDETFVYLVASRDNLVENSEAILVAQVEGRLTAADFAIYDGEFDIYNYSTLPAVVLRDPTISTIADSKNPADAGHTDGRIDNATNPVIITGTVNGALAAGSYFRVYDGSTEIYNGQTAVAGQAVTYGLNTADPDEPVFTFTDSRPLGTTVRKTTNTNSNDTDLNDTYVLSDARVLYTVELVDGETGIPSRVSSRDITISGGNGVIDGGNGTDLLLITETSTFVNGLTDGRLTGIETISLSANPVAAASTITIGAGGAITV